MDTADPVTLSVVDELQADRALEELSIGIELVRRSRARTVHVTGLPGMERAVGPAVARAQAARVRFRMVRNADGSAFAVIGPRVS